jgi:hypothetical protein
LRLAAPSRPLPQPIVPVAMSASGTLMVTGVSVFHVRVTPKFGLIPVG